MLQSSDIQVICSALKCVDIFLSNERNACRVLLQEHACLFETINERVLALINHPSREVIEAAEAIEEKLSVGSSHY